MQKLDLQVYNIDPTKIDTKFTPRDVVHLYKESIKDVLQLESLIFDTPGEKGYEIYYQYYYLKNKEVFTYKMYNSFEDVIRIIFPEENEFSKQCIDIYKVFAAALDQRIEEQYRKMEECHREKYEKIMA